jgi:hypothetical protein
VKVRLWDRVLLVVYAAVGLFSLALLVLPNSMARFFAWIAFGSGGPRGDVVAQDYARFVHAILAAVMIGWMVALAGIALGPLRKRERWAWSTSAGSAMAWFVPDTIYSLSQGYPRNAAFNLVFALAFGVPLFAIHRELR